MLDTVKINHVQHISFTQPRLTDAVSVILRELLSYEHPSKWGLFLTEYGELDKIDTALHERQAVGHISERRWLICLLRSHYISSDIRSRFVLKAKTATLAGDGFLRIS